MVVFPEAQEETENIAVNKKIDLNNFSFKRARELSKGYKGNLSDAVIDERRSYSK